MTDDLVARLRLAVNELYGTHPCGLMNEAADRIEQLESEVSYGHVSYRSLVKEFGEYITDMEKMRQALQKIAAMKTDPEFGTPPIDSAIEVARAALEGKDAKRSDA